MAAAHDTTAQHSDAIVEFYEAAEHNSNIPAREDHPAFSSDYATSEQYSTDAASTAHAKQLSEQPGAVALEKPQRHQRHRLQIK